MHNSDCGLYINVERIWKVIFTHYVLGDLLNLLNLIPKPVYETNNISILKMRESLIIFQLLINLYLVNK